MTAPKIILPTWKLIYTIMANRIFKKRGLALSEKSEPNGFSLIETVIALGLGMITMAMVMTIFANGLKNIRMMKDSQALNSAATSFMSTANYWIKQGKSFRVLPTSPGKILEITLPDNSTTSIDKSILGINGITATTTFTKMAKSVRINFLIQKGSEILSATTTVAQRTF
jgi:type II secretory pathway pseudopilin PulG